MSTCKGLDLETLGYRLVMPKNLPKRWASCELDIFNQPCGNLWDLPSEEIGANQLVHARSRCSPSKGGNSCQGASNSHNAHFRITYKSKPTQKQSNIIFTPVATSKSSFFFFFVVGLKLYNVLVHPRFTIWQWCAPIKSSSRVYIVASNVHPWALGFIKSYHNIYIIKQTTTFCGEVWGRGALLTQRLWQWKDKLVGKGSVNLGPLHTQAKGHDHVIVRALDSHPNVVPMLELRIDPNVLAIEVWRAFEDQAHFF